MLFPALVIGLGGVGLRVLQQARRAVHARFGSVAAAPHVRWLYLDTDPEGIAQAVEAKSRAVFEPEELLLIRLNRANYYMRARPSQVPIETWFNPKMLVRIPRSQLSGGLRCLGRLGFFDHFRLIVDRLRNELKACSNSQPLETASSNTHLGVASTRPRIYVVTGLAGGTGSGIFIDIAYLIRDLSRQLGQSNPETVALLLLPPPDSGQDRIVPLGSTYAALTELNHFSTPGVTYKAWYEYESPGLSDPGPPFTRAVLAPLTKAVRDEAVPKWINLTGAFLFRELFTPLGKIADEYRLRPQAAAAGQGMPYRTFGMYRLTWSRRSLVEQTARQLCCCLVEHWITKESSDALVTAVKTRFGQLLAEHGFGGEPLATSLSAACARVLGNVPELIFNAVADDLTAKGPSSVDDTAVAQALYQLEQLVGQPERKWGSRSKLTLLNGPPPSTLHNPLEEATRLEGDAWHKKLHLMVFSLMEDPQFRLSGVEVAVGLLDEALHELVRERERAVPELNTRAGEAYDRVRGQIGSLTGFAAWFRNKSTKVNELSESLRLFPKLRYQALLAERTCTVARHLLSTYPEFAHDINIVRGRLGDFLRRLADPVTTQAPDVPLGPGRELYPPGCHNAVEARDQILAHLSLEELYAFDRQVQEVIQKEFTSLWQICVAPSTNVFDDLERVLREQAELFVENVLGGIHAADFYLRTHPQEDQIVEEISEAFAQAAPDLTRGAPPAPDEMFIVATPPGPAGDQFCDYSRRALPGKPLLAAVSVDDIVFYREQGQVDLADLEQLGPTVREAYRQMTSVDNFTPHSRTDITEWLPPIPGA